MAYTNGGAQRYDNIANLKLLPLKVYSKQNSMANILSLKLVADIPGAGLVMDT